MALLTYRTDGRRAVFLGSLPCLCVGSIGVATAHSVPVLMFWRAVQAFGASSGMSVGAGVIGDIYRLEERGTAMGIFFGVSASVVLSFVLVLTRDPRHRPPSSVQRSPRYMVALRRTMRHGATDNGGCLLWASSLSFLFISGYRRH